MENIIRPREAADTVGLCERQLRNLEADGKFPKRFPLVPGGRAMGYLKSEVQDWIAERAATRTAA